MPSLNPASWFRKSDGKTAYADEDDGIAALPSQKADPRKISRIVLFAAWGITLATLLGVIGWVVVSEDAINAELETMRPRATLLVADIPRPTQPGAQAEAEDRRSTQSPPQQNGTSDRAPAPNPSSTASATETQAPEPAPDSSAGPIGAGDGTSGGAAQTPDDPYRLAAPLAAHPASGLVEDGPLGPLPKVGEGGRRAWQAYARPYSSLDKRPRVAVVIEQLGLSESATESAIADLPGPVTLAFAPYAPRLDAWVNAARAAGHEVLLGIPMEPLSFPVDDPGPSALLTSLSGTETEQRLQWLLSRATGYVGVINVMGSKFLAESEAMLPFLTELRDRGLLFVDSRINPTSVGPLLAPQLNLPYAPNDVFLDRVPERSNVDSRLGDLEKVARDRGAALAIGRPFPVTIQRVRRWIEGLEEKGLALAPISAVARTPPPN